MSLSVTITMECRVKLLKLPLKFKLIVLHKFVQSQILNLFFIYKISSQFEYINF